ncbi:GspE/PulE family protein [bacterium]|nr:GspE/PulE family protein [bacterium]
MAITSSEKQGSHTDFWNLEQQLGISIWKNSLTIPNPDYTYKKEEIALFHDLNFVYVSNPDKKDSCFVFVSDQTDFFKLFQSLPFLLQTYRCYLCNDRLIKERLSFLEDQNQFQAENSATRLLAQIIEIATSRNASDIHLESHPQSKKVRIRINGILEPLELDEELHDVLFSKIKLISKMDITKTRTPQDGHFPYTTGDGKKFDMRTSTIPGIYGEKIVIRLLPATTIRFSMEELGFQKNEAELIKKQIRQKSGMILFTGPTGSGKTTSLYAILNELISESVNIMTIEDPVEYRIENITQVEVNNLAGISFSSALRAFLRQDPDVILVGEIRDDETAQIAARASQTGHLVLSTLHSNDSFETLRRLKNLGVENDDIASSVKLIISQRLVRRLCHCDLDGDCQICHGSGFSGRVPMMEILEINADLRNRIAKGDSIASIRQAAVQSGFQTLKVVGDKLIKQNLVSAADTVFILSD